MAGKKRIVAVMAVLCLLMSLLAACRSSPVLMETLYEQAAPEVDETQEMLDPDEEGQEDEQFDQEERDDVDTQRNANPDQGIQNENDDGQAEKSADVDYDENHNLQNYAGESAAAEASPSPSPESALSPSPAVSAEPDPSSAADASEPDPSPSETAETPQSDGETEGGQISDGGEDPSTVSPSPEPNPEPSEEPEIPPGREITDAGGSTVTIPENVSRVTAVGAAAQMVEIAGQTGSLLGSNSDLLESDLAQLAFSDAAAIQTWWYGDGSAAIDEGCFSQLLEAAPEVCFVISGQYTFSDEQLWSLNDYGISVVTLYPFSTFDNMKANMRIVGQVLTTDEHNAEEIAERYCSWIDEVLAQTESLASEYNGHTYTVSNSSGEYEVVGTVNSLYIAGWDYDASYSIGGVNGSVLAAEAGDSYGYGLAYAYSPLHKEFVSAAMTAAGISNESTRVRNQHRASDYVYVTPMFHQFVPSVYGSRASYYDSSEVIASADLFVSRMVDSNAYQLGTTSGMCQFPAVVAATQEIKEAIENNWFWQYHGQEVRITYDGSTYSYYRGISGEYEIYVNPQGMISWAEGSVESPLESLWLACKFSGNTIDEAWNETCAFYQEFFEVTLDDGWRYSIFGE